MRKHLFAMASVSVLGLAAAVGSAGAFTLTPIGSDTNVIQIQDRGDRVRGGEFSGRSGGDRVRGGAQIQRSDGNRVTRSRSDDGRRATRSDRQFSGDVRRGQQSEFRREFRRGQHRHVRRGWSRDRRHIFYGAVLVGVPFGYATYASHPCYDWLAGPHGVGYYWNYYRCPV
jgi:hypothetical protein